jgi:hypothetical protein
MQGNKGAVAAVAHGVPASDTQAAFFINSLKIVVALLALLGFCTGKLFFISIQ